MFKNKNKKQKKKRGGGKRGNSPAQVRGPGAKAGASSASSAGQESADAAPAVPAETPSVPQSAADEVTHAGSTEAPASPVVDLVSKLIAEPGADDSSADADPLSDASDDDGEANGGNGDGGGDKVPNGEDAPNGVDASEEIQCNPAKGDGDGAADTSSLHADAGATGGGESGESDTRDASRDEEEGSIPKPSLEGVGEGEQRTEELPTGTSGSNSLSPDETASVDPPSERPVMQLQLPVPLEQPSAAGSGKVRKRPSSAREAVTHQEELQDDTQHGRKARARRSYSDSPPSSPPLSPKQPRSASPVPGLNLPSVKRLESKGPPSMSRIPVPSMNLESLSGTPHSRSMPDNVVQHDDAFAAAQKERTIRSASIAGVSVSPDGSPAGKRRMPPRGRGWGLSKDSEKTRQALFVHKVQASQRKSPVYRRTAAAGDKLSAPTAARTNSVRPDDPQSMGTRQRRRSLSTGDTEGSSLAQLVLKVEKEKKSEEGGFQADAEQAGGPDGEDAGKDAEEQKVITDQDAPIGAPHGVDDSEASTTSDMDRIRAVTSPPVVSRPLPSLAEIRRAVDMATEAKRVQEEVVSKAQAVMDTAEVGTPEFDASSIYLMQAMKKLEETKKALSEHRAVLDAVIADLTGGKASSAPSPTPDRVEMEDQEAAVSADTISATDTLSIDEEPEGAASEASKAIAETAAKMKSHLDALDTMAASLLSEQLQLERTRSKHRRMLAQLLMTDDTLQTLKAAQDLDELEVSKPHCNDPSHPPVVSLESGSASNDALQKQVVEQIARRTEWMSHLLSKQQDALEHQMKMLEEQRNHLRAQEETIALQRRALSQLCPDVFADDVVDLAEEDESADVEAIPSAEEFESHRQKQAELINAAKHGKRRSGSEAVHPEYSRLQGSALRSVSYKHMKKMLKTDDSSDAEDKEKKRKKREKKDKKRRAEDQARRAEMEAAKNRQSSGLRNVSKKFKKDKLKHTSLRVATEDDRYLRQVLTDLAMFGIDVKYFERREAIELARCVQSSFERQNVEGARECKIPPGFQQADLVSKGVSFRNERWPFESRCSGMALCTGAFFLDEQVPITHHLLLGLSDVSPISNELKPVLNCFGQRVASISCGTNIFAAISDLGELFVLAPKELHQSCLGVGHPPEGWSGTFISRKLLGRRVRMVECGAVHVAAVTDANEVVLWGVNVDVWASTPKKSIPPPPPPPMVKGSAAFASCPVINRTPSGTIITAAQSTEQKAYVMDPDRITGQLGMADRSVSTPVMLKVPGRVLSISCGWLHTAVATDEAVFTCGANSDGQLGRDGPATELLPVLLLPSLRFSIVQVACGGKHTLALSDDGMVFAWGSNSRGQLGVGLRSGQLGSPQQIRDLNRATAISAGASHSACLRMGGEVWTWGCNGFGQLGQGSGSSDGQSSSLSVPTLVPHFKSKPIHVIVLSCGPHSTGAVDLQGRAYVWGMCTAADGSHSSEPQLQEALNDRHFVTRIACGATHVTYLSETNLSLAMEALQAACKNGAPFNLTPLKTVLMSIPSPGHFIRAIQDRALVDLVEKEKQSKGGSALPHISLSCAYLEFETPEDKVYPLKVSRGFVMQNKSEHSILVTVTPDSSVANCSFLPSAAEVCLQKGQMTSFKVSFKCEEPLREEAAGLIKFKVEMQKVDVKKCCTYYYLFCVASPPGARDTQAADSSSTIDMDSSSHCEGEGDLQGLVNAMATYVPRVLVRRFCDKPNPPTAPLVQTFPAAILFIDISGFTSLNERLAALGAAGPELVSKHINAYFESLIEAVNTHGGDVLKFAGDALICMFSDEERSIGWAEEDTPSDDVTGDVSEPGSDHDAEETDTAGSDAESAVRRTRSPQMPMSLSDLTLRAVQCGFEIQTRLAEYDSNEGFRLTLHIGIGSGDLLSMCVGGYDGSWEYIVSGEPLEQLRTAVDNSHTGEVVVSEPSWQLIESRCEGVPRGNDFHVQKIVQTLPVASKPPITPRVEIESALRCFIPQAVLAGLDAGQIGWMDELRRVTVLFVNLHTEVDHSDTGKYCRDINDVLRRMQKVIFQFEGMIRQFLSDDKGTVLIAAFGLPPLSHDNDAERGVRAAMRIHAALESVGMSNTVGVTTGQVYTGSVGSGARQEYAMVGDVVNMAARLMVAASKMDVGILVDHATYAASCAHTSYRKLEAISVKGKKNKIEIYEPQPHRFRPHYDHYYMLGRYPIKKALSERVDRMAELGESSIVVVEGVEGMGKSIVAGYCQHLAMQQSARVLKGMADPMNRTAFFAWGTILMDLLGLPDTITDAVASKLYSQLSADLSSDWFRLVPLLADVLPELKTAFVENDTVKAMDSKKRLDSTANLLKHLIQWKACGPVLVIFENLHCIDSASLRAALNVRKGMLAFMLLCTTRPMQGPRTELMRTLYDDRQTSVLELSGLSISSCCLLAERRLGIVEPCEPLREMVTKAVPSIQGNPYFIVQFAASLRDSGLIAIDETGAARVSKAAEEQSESTLPEAVQRIINSRIDRLSASAQMVLKVGKQFSLQVLQSVYPIEGEKKYLEQELNLLCTLNIISLKGRSARDAMYFFNTDSILEVSYSRMLFSQRKQLHEMLAAHYQQHESDASLYAPLAHHWGKVVLGEKAPSNGMVVVALKYTKLASDIANKHNARDEAEQWLQQTVALAQLLPESEERAALEQEAVDKLAILPTARDVRKQVRVPLMRTLSSLTIEDPDVVIQKRGIPDINSADSSGWSKLHNACEEPDFVLLEALLCHELLDVNAKNMNGNVALHYFVRSWDAKNNVMCERLLQMFVWRGTNVNSKNNTAETPLHSACLYAKPRAVLALINHGADVSARTNDYMTPMHYVARTGNLEIMQILLDHGGLPDPEVPEGYDTPLEVARKSKMKKVIGVLEAAICRRMISEDDAD